jgi:hypothetical protein
MAGAGTAGNIYGSVEQGKTAGLQQQQLKNELSYQNNPAKFAQLVQSFMQPLSQGLVQNVSRGANAAGAGAGLGDSPGLMAYIVSQALAPYSMQEQQTAVGEAGNIAFPSSVGTPQYPQTNMTNTYAMLAKMFPGVFNSGGGSTPKPGLTAGGWNPFDTSSGAEDPFMSELTGGTSSGAGGS